MDSRTGSVNCEPGILLCFERRHYLARVIPVQSPARFKRNIDIVCKVKHRLQSSSSECWLKSAGVGSGIFKNRFHLNESICDVSQSCS